ncbi:MAG: hypothetical protein H6559_16895 [Lewinellaceae bacterium]|nr:hypothetical protein [Lewinellaceae bacterium]
MENVSRKMHWYFIDQLNRLTGHTYRLPSEAEWNTPPGLWKNQGYQYAGGNEMEEVGWYKENSGGETKVVGLKSPTSWESST